MPKWPSPFQGGKLGIFAPSSSFSRPRFDKGLEILRALGFELILHPQIDARHGYLAGTDDARLNALFELMESDEVDAIIAARGGYGAHRLLERLDLDRLAKADKLLVGFSDVCALHSALQRAGLVSLHGPVVTQLGDLSVEDHQLLARLIRNEVDGDLVYSASGQTLSPGQATGTIAGGCLSVIVPLVGTPHLFLPDDALLLLEDVEEAPYRIDRMLTHLRLAGVLHRVRGIVVGDFTRCHPPRPEEQSVEDVLVDRLGDLSIPVVTGFPFGHGVRNSAIPLGSRATLNADHQTLTVHRPERAA